MAAQTTKSVDEQIKFISAVENGNIERLKPFLKLGFDVNDQQAYGFDQGVTPLMIAAGHGNAAMVNFLLERGATVNFFDQRDMETALFKAVRSADNTGTTDKFKIDYPRTIQLLLKAGANPDLPNRNQGSPLFFARKAWVVKALLTGGANPNPVVKDQPLIEHAGDIEILKLLLAAGANPNVVNIWGDTALYKASIKGSMASTGLLLKKMDRDVAMRLNNQGFTALYYAAIGRTASNADIVKLLLEFGFRPDAASLGASIATGQLTAARLQLAADPQLKLPDAAVINTSLKDVESKIYAYLLADQPAMAKAVYAAAETNACGRETPLMSAVNAGNIEAVRALIALGVNVNFQTPQAVSSYKVPPHPMSSSGHSGIAYMLPPPCDGELKIDAASAAADSQSVSIEPNVIKLQIDSWHDKLGKLGKGRGVTARDAALSIAVQREDIEIARVLIAAGADPRLESHYSPDRLAQSKHQSKHQSEQAETDLPINDHGKPARTAQTTLMDRFKGKPPLIWKKLLGM